MDDFQQATTRLLDTCITLADIGEALGVTWIRQARIDRSSASYRPPPEGWPVVLAQLARERAAELEALAGELER